MSSVHAFASPVVAAVRGGIAVERRCRSSVADTAEHRSGSSDRLLAWTGHLLRGSTVAS